MFDRSNNTDAFDVEMDVPVLQEESSFKMMGFTFFSKSGWGSGIFSIAKTAFKKIQVLIRFKVLSPEVALYLLYSHA